ncbi:AsnC family transcriptional regulator [Roseivivax halodurans JCM 10272]|uniref:AsnC family transcriptional regulator n=1 Tax=Roseivivax halodurans JCM 10272 TaxID=1449350 RepID=X7EGQ8_9RHOB|nr:Lrp/AsnC family transcriptional regulator [Roseivivax halodurans]ETX14293.1 AsnC family transcriptional regulator [Roseivivax halodurans JCM 10272]
MDDIDYRLIAALRRDARASLSELGGTLGLSRTTVRARLEKLRRSGDILGFTLVLKEDLGRDAVRALMMLGIEGRGTDRILRHLAGYPEVRELHSTNGRWDVIVELGTADLEALDDVLARVRRLDGVATSETSLLLSTKKSARGQIGAQA